MATVTATGAGMLMSVQPEVGSSNTDGDFTFSGLRAGTYHVAISEFGDIDFPVTMRDVTVGVGLSAEVSFQCPRRGPAQRRRRVPLHHRRHGMPLMMMPHTRAA